MFFVFDHDDGVDRVAGDTGVGDIRIRWLPDHGLEVCFCCSRQRKVPTCVTRVFRDPLESFVVIIPCHGSE